MNIIEEEYKRLLGEYKRVNDRFEKTVIYRVGESQGFYSEINCMLTCMLWCYNRKIKFTIYSDGANFGGGNGWKEFFEPFCEENHDKRNEHVNRRHQINWKHPLWRFDAWIFRKINKVNYLTQDVFFPCLYRDQISGKGEKEGVVWPELGIYNYDDFGKLAKFALRYNKKTEDEIKRKILDLNLPEEYVSIQIRGGDKIIECDNLLSPKIVVEKINELDINNNLFVFTDDYRYIEELKKLKPNLNIFTLTKKEEKGYENDSFQKMKWEEKREELIKLFAMVEICIQSTMHLGSEQSNANDYIKSQKNKSQYIMIWNDKKTSRKFRKIRKSNCNK